MELKKKIAEIVRTYFPISDKRERLHLATEIMAEIDKMLPKLGDKHATSDFRDGYIQGWDDEDYIQGWDDYDDNVREALGLEEK